MKKVFVIAILLLSCAGIKAQDKKKVDCKTLASLISKAVFSDFVKFTKQLEYLVLDSSKGEDETIFYFTKEPVIHGNSLACTTDKTGHKITLLTFTTYSEQKYLELKKQLKELKFVSS